MGDESAKQDNEPSACFNDVSESHAGVQQSEPSPSKHPQQSIQAQQLQDSKHNQIQCSKHDSKHSPKHDPKHSPKNDPKHNSKQIQSLDSKHNSKQSLLERESGSNTATSEAERPKNSHQASKSSDRSTDSLNAAKEDPFAGLSFSVGVAENKNSHYRDKMEDVHTYVANYAEKLDWGYFAIFDGHAGKSTARWCGNNLHALVEEEILTAEATAKPYDLRHILCNAFHKADETLDKDGSGSSGSTAAVAVLRWESESAGDEDFSSNSRYDFIPGAHHKRVLYTSNVGDSRIVLCRAGKSYRLSYDHKASDPSEMERIREAGGLIVKNRVNGVFAITRSLGDSYIKNLVTGSPFTTATEILAEDEFLILACDGVWDVISDQQACKFVQEVFRQQLEQNGVYDPKAAAKRLCDYAIENATTDNVTVMVVLLDPGVFSQGVR